MDEYIKREAAIEAVKHAWAKGLEPSQYIENIPAANVAPVVHGHWNYRCPTDGVSYRYCSKCLSIVYDGLYVSKNYCPNCGARMDGGEDNA